LASGFTAKPSLKPKKKYHREENELEEVEKNKTSATTLGKEETPRERERVGRVGQELAEGGGQK
jgi:hypothetical protein